MHTIKRGEPLPINQALNRPRAKLGLDLSAWMAIDFAHAAAPTGIPAQPTGVLGEREEMTPNASTETLAAIPSNGGDGRKQPSVQAAAEPQPKSNGKSDPMAGYDFDGYQGRLYRVFEGTVLEGVVTILCEL